MLWLHLGYLLILLTESVALVESAKSLRNNVLVVSSLDTIAENAEEHGEIDWTWCLAGHLLKLLVVAQSAESVETGPDVVLRDDSVLVLINEAEGLFECGHLILSEHGEHIGAAPLGALLRRDAPNRN